MVKLAGNQLLTTSLLDKYFIPVTAYKTSGPWIKCEAGVLDEPCI